MKAYVTHGLSTPYKSGRGHFFMEMADLGDLPLSLLLELPSPRISTGAPSYSLEHYKNPKEMIRNVIQSTRKPSYLNPHTMNLQELDLKYHVKCKTYIAQDTLNQPLDTMWIV
jgi:hypothetical protein